MKSKQDFLEVANDDAILLEPRKDFDKAISGVTHDGRIVYDLEKVLKALEKSGMTYEDACDYFDYNIVRGIQQYEEEERPVFVSHTI